MSSQKTAHAEANVVPETRRLTAPEIFDAAADIARVELRRSVRKLAFSGVAGGLTMGLTGLGVAVLGSMLGPGGWQDAVSHLIYPVGFIAVIIGRAQLFTENTLYPVILVFDEHRHLFRTLRLWGVVFSANLVGALLFALLAVKSSALNSNVVDELVRLGTEASSGTVAHLFWSGVIGGWLIALVAWTVTASHWTIGQLAIIYLLTFVVGIGHFAHCIASSCEILAGVVSGMIPAAGYFAWLLPATLGNICGGVLIVSLLNYGQVKEI
jgi:formate/nitrite transporter FocA (FNT family)